MFIAATASSSCIACPIRHYTESEGSASCLPCKDGFECLLGAYEPLPSADLKLNTAKNTNPFEEWIDLHNKELVEVRTWVLSVSLVVGACVLAVAVIVHKTPYLRDACLCAPEQRITWLRVDLLFSRAHFRPDDSPLINKKTTLGIVRCFQSDQCFIGAYHIFTCMHLSVFVTAGGFFTAACIISVLLFGVQLVCQYYVSPPIDSSVTTALPPFEPHGTFRLNVTVHGNGFDGCRTSDPFLTRVTPNQQSIPLRSENIKIYGLPTNSYIGISSLPQQRLIAKGEFTPYSSDFEVDPVGGNYRSFNTPHANNGSCTMTWECTKCRMLTTWTELGLFSAGWSIANWLDYTFEAPGFTSSSEDTAEEVPHSTQGRVFVGANSKGARNGALFYYDKMDFQKIVGVSTTVPLSLTSYQVVNEANSTVKVAFQPAASLIAANPQSAKFNNSELRWPAASLQTYDGKFQGFFVMFHIDRNVVSIVKTIKSPPMQTLAILLFSQSSSIVSLFVVVFMTIQAMFHLFPDADRNRHSRYVASAADVASSFIKPEMHMGDFDQGGADGFSGGDGSDGTVGGGRDVVLRPSSYRAPLLPATVGNIGGAVSHIDDARL
jgi:hypothetical protein